MPGVLMYRAGRGLLKPVYPPLHEIKTAPRVRKKGKLHHPADFAPAYVDICSPPDRRERPLQDLAPRYLEPIPFLNATSGSSPETETKARFTDIVETRLIAWDRRSSPSRYRLRPIRWTICEFLPQTTEALMGNAGTTVMEARDVSFAMALLEVLEREVPKVRGLGEANSPEPRFWIMDAWGERNIEGRGGTRVSG